MAAHHTPVMVDEVLAGLNVQSGGLYVDCTLGAGGHSEAILGAGGLDVRTLGIDLDPGAVELAKERFEAYGQRATLVQGNFADLGWLAHESGFTRPNGVLFDFGLSSVQLDARTRGFSFQREAPLDMRFDQGQTLTAHQVVNNYSEARLADIIFRYGEERGSRRVAHAIVGRRPVETTTELASIVSGALGGRGRRRIHPATRTFQALRIEVNGELDNVGKGIDEAIGILRSGGRLVAISYHSLEDRVVKNIFRRESTACVCPPSTPVCICEHEPTIHRISRRVMKPSATEVKANPRARSARMRVAEKI